MVFSCSAFILGMVTIVTTWKQALKSSFMVTQLFTGSQNATSVAWHGLQAVSELLITIFLTRALLKSRNGSQRPDNIVNCLIRSVIQIGFFGTIWALAGLTTWFFMRRAVIYEIFDLTVGSIYTHMIFDTLLSRVRLRDRLAAESSPFEFVLSTQGQVSTHLDFRTTLDDRANNLRPHPDIFEGQPASPVTKVPAGPVSIITIGNLNLEAPETPSTQGIFEEDVLGSGARPSES